MTFLQARPFEFGSMGAVNDAIEDGIAYGWIPDELVPAAHGNLAGHQQRALLVSVVDDFREIAPLLGGQRLRSPVVDDQRPGMFEHRRHSWQPVLAVSGGQFGEQPWGAPIEHGEAFPAGLWPRAQANHDLPTPVGPVITGC